METTALGSSRRPWLLLGGLTWVMCLATVTAPAAPVHAQGQQDSALDTARQHMERGQAHYAAGRYEEAAKEFIAAYDAKPLAAFLYNAGMAYEKRGEPGKAADYYARYLSAEPNAPDAAEVRSRIERLRTEQSNREGGTGIEIVTKTEHHTERVEQDHGPPIQAPNPSPQPQPKPQEMKSMLSVQTTPRGATIRVMGPAGMVANGTSPLLQTLAPGSYDVIIEKQGFRKIERPVSVQPGKVYTLIIEMSQGEFAGLLRVTSEPSGAEVRMDDEHGDVLGKTPWQTQATAGLHTIWLSRPGYETAKREVTVEAGQEQKVDVPMERARWGKLRIVANVAGAKVRIDGNPVGQVPLEIKLDAGPHEVRVEAENMKPFERSVIVARGQLTPVRVQLHQSVPRGGGWATAVIGGLVLATGATLAVLSEHTYDDLRHEARDGRLASNDRRLFKGRMMAIGADTAFGLGGLFALLSLYYFVRDPLPDSEGTVLEPRDFTVTPEVGLGGAGARLEVRF